MRIFPLAQALPLRTSISCARWSEYEKRYSPRCDRTVSDLINRHGEQNLRPRIRRTRDHRGLLRLVAVIYRTTSLRVSFM